MDVRGQRQTLAEDQIGARESDYDKKVEMIDTEQKQALYDFLEAHQNQEKYKFIVSPTPMFPDYLGGFASPGDIWTGYAAQREEILTEIGKIAESKSGSYVLPVFLGGDVHQSLVAKLTFQTPDQSKSVTLHSIISSAFNWYVLGVQRGAGKSGNLISKYRTKSNYEKGDMYCEVIANSEIVKNNYAVISADEEGISVAQFKVGWFGNKRINTNLISRAQLTMATS